LGKRYREGRLKKYRERREVITRGVMGEVGRDKGGIDEARGDRSSREREGEKAGKGGRGRNK